MSANTYELLKAVRARLTSDTGSGGLFNGSAPLVTGVYSLQAPQNTSANASTIYPYILLVPVSGVDEKVFSTSTYAVDSIFQVSIYCDIEDGSQAGDTIAARVRTRLDRYALTITGWTPSQLMRLDGRVFVDEGIYHWSEDYRAYMALGS